MNVVVAVPTGFTEPLRRRAFEFVRWRLSSAGWRVEHADGDPAAWSKGTAVARVVERARDADVIVMHDADVLVDLDALAASVSTVTAGAPWAVPHRTVHRLDQASTDHVLEAGELPARPGLARLAYTGVIGGGVVVVRRDVWDACPLDPRFVGWGGEDEAWGWALSTLYGPIERGESILWHLWHEHAAPGARRPPRAESQALLRAYRRARAVPRYMRAVIDDRAPDPPAVLDPPARFRRTGGQGVFMLTGRVVRLAPGAEFETTNADEADILDRNPFVVRV